MEVNYTSKVRNRKRKNLGRFDLKGLWSPWMTKTFEVKTSRVFTLPVADFARIIDFRSYKFFLQRLWCNDKNGSVLVWCMYPIVLIAIVWLSVQMSCTHTHTGYVDMPYSGIVDIFDTCVHLWCFSISTIHWVSSVMGSLQLSATMHMVAESMIVEIACNSFIAHSTAMKRHAESESCLWPSLFQTILYIHIWTYWREKVKLTYKHHRWSSKYCNLHKMHIHTYLLYEATHGFVL